MDAESFGINVKVVRLVRRSMRDSVYCRDRLEQEVHLPTPHQRK